MSDTSTPSVFLPYQQELWSATAQAQVTVIEKSRRTGYSWALAAIAAERAALARSEGGSDVLYMGYEREMTREFIDYVAEWARVFQMAVDAVEEFVWVDPQNPDKSIGAFRIRFASSYEVIALPSVPRALRGKQGLVILDEAAFMDDLDEVLKAAFALLIWGGKVIICSTHNGETNPFNELVVGIRAGKYPYALLRCTFDDALRDGLYRRICYTQGKLWTPAAEQAWRDEIYRIYRDKADEELDVIPNPSSGVYLSRALLEARSTTVIPVLRWTAPPGFVNLPEDVRVATVLAWCTGELQPVLRSLGDEPHALGEDFGRLRDLTVMWLLAIRRDMSRDTRLIVELRDMPFEQQRQVLFYILDRTPRFRKGVMDASGNGAYLAEVAAQRYGARIEQLKLSEQWYRENMPPMRQAIEDAAFSLPRDRDVLDDFSDLRLVRGVARIPERRLNDAGQARHGDAAIAGCLAYAASRAEAEEYGYRAATPGEDAPLPGASRGWGGSAAEQAEELAPRGMRGLPTHHLRPGARL